MPASAPEPCQENRTRDLGSPGAIVLSASGRLLFIDRNAIGLLRILDSDWVAPTGAQSLPPCLMTMVQEIAAHSTIDRCPDSFIDKCPDSVSVHMSQVLGSRSQPIRVQGFMVPRDEQREKRFVLVLSRSNPGTMA